MLFRSLVIPLGLLAALSASHAACVGGYCPSPPPGAVLAAQYVAGGTPIGGYGAAPPRVMAPIPVFERPSHPFVRAAPLPDPEKISPQTRILFEVTDLQTDNLISPPGQHVRRSEFHNSVDAAGNTFNVYSSAFRISVPLALTSLALLLFASSVGLAHFFGSRRDALLAARSVAPALPLEEPLLDQGGSVPVDASSDHIIEWDAPQVVHLESTWDSLLQLCAGDVMAAAASIKAQVDADPSLNPSSTEAFRRAIEALQHKQADHPT